jgi:hypothetical protein
MSPNLIPSPSYPVAWEEIARLGRMEEGVRQEEG